MIQFCGDIECHAHTLVQLGTGNALAQAGPLGILIGYALMGLAVVSNIDIMLPMQNLTLMPGRSLFYLC